MSLGIAFKGPEGIVLAADSRVTLYSQSPEQHLLIPSTYDNATKLLQIIKSQKYAGAVTYGLGVLGQKEFRTPSSLMLEFEDYLNSKKITNLLKVEDYAKNLSNFFLMQWNTRMLPPVSNTPIVDMAFIVGGYDENEPYGKIFEFQIPSNPTPREDMEGTFGLTYGGQREWVDRLLHGFDDNLPIIAQPFLQISDIQREALKQHLVNNLNAPIPYQFLSLQDCVNLAIFLIKTTMGLQAWLTSIRGVGGVIDIATVTRAEGFKPIQQKEIRGDMYYNL
jgi:hypothetical protein